MTARWLRVAGVVWFAGLGWYAWGGGWVRTVVFGIAAVGLFVYTWTLAAAWEAEAARRRHPYWDEP